MFIKVLLGWLIMLESCVGRREDFSPNEDKILRSLLV